MIVGKSLAGQRILCGIRYLSGDERIIPVPVALERGEESFPETHWGNHLQVNLLKLSSPSLQHSPRLGHCHSVTWTLKLASPVGNVSPPNRL